MDRSRLQDQLIRDEGLRLKPYVDTVGKITIAVGRNLTDRGITQTEAFYLLDHDIDLAELDCRARLPWWDELDPVRQGALTNIMFNIGAKRFMGFKRALERTEAKDWDGASAEWLDSHWSEQVGNRALRLASQIRDGVWR
jgi:lysozyme